MRPTAFQFVPLDDILTFVKRQQEEVHQIAHLAIPPFLSSDEIVVLSQVGTGAVDKEPETPTHHEQKRIYIKTTNAQRQTLFKENTKHGVAKQLSHYQEKTRISKPTLKKLPKKIQSGEDVLSPVKHGRKPKHTQELLRAVASKLWAGNMTLLEARRKIIPDTIDAFGKTRRNSQKSLRQPSTGT